MLSLEREFGIPCYFKIFTGSDTSGTFSLYFAPPSLQFERPVLKYGTDFCSCKYSAKVSLMLDNPFLVSSLYKLSHISFVSSRLARKSPKRIGLNHFGDLKLYIGYSNEMDDIYKNIDKYNQIKNQKY